MSQMMICIPCMCNYYLYDFLEIIDNKKFENVMIQMMMCTYCM
jgi:hypothetical protein